MQLTHSFTVPAGVDVAWNTFMDLREVGECFPGATVTDASGDSFSGQVKVKLGPIAMVYSGTGEFTERDDSAHRAVIKAEGKDKRGNGTAGATATIQLESVSESETKVDVTTDLLVTGKPAQFGRGVMQDVSDKLLGQFVQCIEGKLAGDHASAPAAKASSGASPESDAQAGTAKKEPAGQPAKPLGTAAMFGATAGDQSWESLSNSDSGKSGSDKGDSAKPASGKGEAGDKPAPASDKPASAPEPSRSFSQPARQQEDDHLDLGATILPVILKSYRREIAIALAGALIGWKLARFLPG